MGSLCSGNDGKTEPNGSLQLELQVHTDTGNQSTRSSVVGMNNHNHNNNNNNNNMNNNMNNNNNNNMNPDNNYNDKLTKQKKTDKDIDRALDKMQRVSFKLMLLGAGEGGKTTLLRQMKRLHGGGFTESELKDSKPFIIRNVVEAMRTLAIYSELLSDSGEDTKVSKENEEIRSRVAGLNENQEFTREIWEDFEKLWNDKGIRNTYDLSHRFQLIDTAEYLLSNMSRFWKSDYIPLFEDLVHSRNRTIGVNRLSFAITDQSGKVTEAYELYDVGGQRTERRKWVHFFDHITAIMYVAALSSFNQTLFEDARINRLVESLALFRGVINMDGLEHAYIVFKQI